MKYVYEALHDLGNQLRAERAKVEAVRAVAHEIEGQPNRTGDRRIEGQIEAAEQVIEALNRRTA